MPAVTASTKQATKTATVRRMVEDARRLRFELGNQTDAEAIAQAAACAAPILAASTAPQNVLAWLLTQLEPWEQLALDRAQVLSTKYSVLPDVCRHWFEQFLQADARNHRKRHGVFFTPQPIAKYIVAHIDGLLCDEFDLPHGLATHSKIQSLESKIFLLDPACGTGVFLLAAIDHILRRLPRRRWNAFVPDLLSRLVGIEILPAAALLAKLNITLHLAATGYDFADPTPINIITGDALSPETQSKVQNLKSKIFPVVLGNPPFSSLSANTNPWIAQLVRGDAEIRGYIRANGQQLNERKTWLHDDYVKFIRLAQWHVEQSGCGIVGFVTNHGYLDNATFRLMRHELLRVFPRIEIVDLHGNRKKHEIAPDGTRDENVFGLDQGIAIGIFCRPRGVGVSPAVPARSVSERPLLSHIEYSELWGPREAKLTAIASASLAPRPFDLTPQSPDWRFVPTPPGRGHPDYGSAWSLADAMPVHTTAPVTARDHFVVAFTPEELEARIEQFRDLSIPDDEIRRCYFNRTRSARYPPGDTRGWKLTQARQTIAADADWQRHIKRCLYRPFDWRYIYWHPAMIDWPRTEVTRHLIEQGSSRFKVQGSKLEMTTLNLEPGTLNLCLIARRQQLPTQPCTFFWISDGLALDGVIRSDNRGSESLFPLYVVGTLRVPSPNFARTFIEQFVAATKLTWLPLGRGDLIQAFGPEDLLAYIYALFHSPTYREQHADALRTDFPRVLMPPSPHVFAKMSRFGSELIDLHLLRTPHSPEPRTLNPEPLHSFRAGGHFALKKWLQPKHRSSADPEFARITAAIARTIELMAQIDAD